MQISNATHSISALVDKAHEEMQELPRPHMGASLLGHHCDRYLWLKFRHAVIEKFSGRMLRLFRRGHMEEATIVQDLQAIGMVITDYGDEQSRVDFGKHVSGSIDGIIQSGVPGSKKPHILECKTHSQKSFDLLKKEGLAKAKPMHYVQCNVYMLGKGLDRALYYAINKNTDEIYTERVRLDEALAISAVERGQRIATADRMPEPCPGASPSWYLCKSCPAYEFCHADQQVTEKNCRACGWSTARDDGTWYCEKWQATIPLDGQRVGCVEFVLHPDIDELK